MPKTITEPLILNEDELAFLMGLWGADTLVGFTSKPLEMRQDAEKIRNGLHKKKILLKQAGHDFAGENYRPWLEALFRPQKAVIVVRDLPEIGRQQLVFCASQGTAVLHSQPHTGQHRIESLTPSQVNTMLAAWFPVSAYPAIQPDGFQVSHAQFEQCRDLAESGQTEKAIQALRLPQGQNDLAAEWVAAIATRRFNASFALLDIEGGTLKSVNSFALLAGGQTAWLIGQEGEEEKFRIIRANNRAQIQLTQLISFLTTSNEKPFFSFVLTRAELAFCFSAVNRTDLGFQFLQAGAAGQADSESLQANLQQGGQMLAKRGLCTVTSQGLAILASDLELALFPLIRFDYIIQAGIQGDEGQSSAAIYVQRGRKFSAYLVAPHGRHVLEHGQTERLPDYLGALLMNFAAKCPAHPDWGFEITLERLQGLFEKHSTDIRRDVLAKNGAPKTAIQSLANDLEKPAYRASLLRLNAGSQTQREQAAKLDKPTLLLLQGKGQAWIFHFPASKTDSRGLAQSVDRQGFEAALAAFVG